MLDLLEGYEKMKCPAHGRNQNYNLYAYPFQLQPKHFHLALMRFEPETTELQQ